MEIGTKMLCSKDLGFIKDDERERERERERKTGIGKNRHEIEFAVVAS